MRRNDIKIVSLETLDKKLAIKLANELKSQFINKYGHEVQVTIHDFEVDPGMVKVTNYGKYLAIYELLKEEVDTTISKIKKQEFPLGVKQVHILLPNITSLIVAELKINIKVNCCQSTRNTIEDLRKRGLYGLSDDNSQILDVFAKCKYKNYDFDAIFRLGERCDEDAKLTYIDAIDDSIKLGDYVTKYILRTECPDYQLNGKEAIARFNPSSDISIKIMADKLIEAINIYGIE